MVSPFPLRSQNDDRRVYYYISHLGLGLIPHTSEASWTSPSGLATVLKAGMASGICLPLWVPPSLNLGLIILLSYQVFDALKRGVLNIL